MTESASLFFVVRRAIEDLGAVRARAALVGGLAVGVRLATIRLVSPLDGRTMVDLLFASSGIEPEIVATAESMHIGAGIICPVARRGHLIALKILARSDRRPQDDQDLGALLDGADDDELARARVALALVSERGFARGKDLAAEFDEQVGRWS